MKMHIIIIFWELMHSLSASILAAVMILCGKGEGGREREGGREGRKRMYICTLILILY